MVTEKEKINEALGFKNKEVYKYLNCKLETFCSLVNEAEDFNVDSCEEGHVEFMVPLNWLVDFLNKENSLEGENNALRIKDLNDLNDWYNESTYYETEYVLRKAIEDDIVIGIPIVHNCDYCKNAFNSKK